MKQEISKLVNTEKYLRNKKEELEAELKMLQEVDQEEQDGNAGSQPGSDANSQVASNM